MASLTRADIESQTVARIGKLMTLVGLDGVTKDGTNADLNDPIRRSVRFSGYSVTDPALIQDVDLVPIVDLEVERVYDLTELRTLETIWSNWSYVDMKASLQEQKLSQLTDRIEKRIEFLTERVRQPYGLNVGAPAGGRITHGRRDRWGRGCGFPGSVQDFPRGFNSGWYDVTCPNAYWGFYW